MLKHEDRVLVEMALRGNLSLRNIAELLKVPPGTVTRRLQRLSARLYDPLVVALTADACPLAPDYRQLGIEHFLQGRSARELASLHQVPAAQIRQMLTYVRGWHKGLSTHLLRPSLVSVED